MSWVQQLHVYRWISVSDFKLETVCSQWLAICYYPGVPGVPGVRTVGKFCSQFSRALCSVVDYVNVNPSARVSCKQGAWCKPCLACAQNLCAFFDRKFVEAVC